MTTSLYKQLCSVNCLYSSWLSVKEKGSAGGIDKLSVKEFDLQHEKQIESLAKELENLTYIPEPYQEVQMRKSDGDFRSLGLPTVRDKIVQYAIQNLIGPLLEKNFLNVSYAYRKNKGAVKAICRVKHMIYVEHREWVTVCDIDKYFDNINHSLLFEMLDKKLKDEALLNLIKMFICMGRVDKNNKWKDTEKGIPQGAVISPLLSNFYLNSFDKMMTDNQFGLLRYADDFIVLSHKEEQAYDALNKTKFFIENNLKLCLNPDYLVKNVKDGFDFLGIHFQGKTIGLSQKKLNNITDKINNAFGIENNKYFNMPHQQSI